LPLSSTIHARRERQAHLKEEKSMSRMSNLYVAIAAIGAALAAVPVASSANSVNVPPGFEYSAPGTAASKLLDQQVLTTDGGTLKCNSLVGTEKLNKLQPLPALELYTSYSSCSAFSIATVDVTPNVLIGYNADGTLSLLSELTITPKIFGFPMCHVVLKPQSGLGTVSYTNKDHGGSQSVVATQTVKDLVYESTGGGCGPSGTDGTLTGSVAIERVGGGGLWWFAT
jgi:hypothetical protein